MDEIRPGLQEDLVGQRGVLAQIVQSGTVKIGDRVHIIDPNTRTYNSLTPLSRQI